LPRLSITTGRATENEVYYMNLYLPSCQTLQELGWALQFEKVITGKKFIAPKDLIKHTNSLLSLENEKKHVSLDQREIGQGNKVSTQCM